MRIESRTKAVAAALIGYKLSPYRESVRLGKAGDAKLKRDCNKNPTWVRNAGAMCYAQFVVAVRSRNGTRFYNC